MNHRKFRCDSCKREYAWFMIGGTNKLIGDPVGYSDNNSKRCAYCSGTYADGTVTNGGKKADR